MRLAIVGSVAYDAIETANEKRDRVLGGSATFCSVAASRFAPSGVVGIIGEDFDPDHIAALQAHGVDTSGIEQVPGKTFFWSGRYSDDFISRETLDTQLNVFAQFDPKLSDPYRQAPYLFLANIQPELQAKVLDQASGAKFVACDTMNLWIETARDALLAVLSRVDLLTINDEEAFLLSSKRNIHQAAKVILGMGPSHLIIKRGEFGAALYSGDRMFLLPAYPVMHVVDPTGAGDSFAGGLMGYVAASGQVDFEGLCRAMVVGTLIASFQVESFSMQRLSELSWQELATRMRSFAEMTNWTDLNLKSLWMEKK